MGTLGPPASETIDLSGRAVIPSPTDATSLTFESVRFAYRRRGPIVLDVSWEPRSPRTVLLGSNGAGKSTMLAIAAGAFRPSRGRVSFGDLEPTGRTRSRYLAAVGWMPQRVRPIAALTCHEQVAYLGWLKGLSKTEAWWRAAGELERFGLTDVAGRRVSEISGGQLRRVGLAQTLVARPAVVLLDEPTAGLDPAQRAAFRELVARLPRSVTLVVSTHQVDDLDDLFDDVAVLAGGLIVWNDRIDRFMALAPAGSPRAAESAYLSIVTPE